LALALTQVTRNPRYAMSSYTPPLPLSDDTLHNSSLNQLYGMDPHERL
jgi:hypothetical protein